MMSLPPRPAHPSSGLPLTHHPGFSPETATGPFSAVKERGDQDRSARVTVFVAAPLENTTLTAFVDLAVPEVVAWQA
jgi:hypothetical protein